MLDSKQAHLQDQVQSPFVGDNNFHKCPINWSFGHLQTCFKAMTMKIELDQVGGVLRRIVGVSQLSVDQISIIGQPIMAKTQHRGAGPWCRSIESVSCFVANHPESQFFLFQSFQKPQMSFSLIVDKFILFSLLIFSFKQ